RRAADGSLVFDWPVYPLEEVEIVAYNRPSMRARRLPPPSVRGRRLPGRRLITYRTTHYARFIPTVSVPRPYAYVVTSPHVADKLRQHSVVVEALEAPVDLDVETYVVLGNEKTFSPDICTGIERFETVLTVRKERRYVRFEPGALVLRTGQRLGNLGGYLLGPRRGQRLARWEFFDPDIALGQPFPVHRLMHAERLSTRRVAD